MLGDEWSAAVFATVVLNSIAFFAIFCYTGAMAIRAVDGDDGCFHISMLPSSRHIAFFHHTFCITTEMKTISPEAIGRYLKKDRDAPMFKEKAHSFWGNEKWKAEHERR
jgi:hypothetical protein